MTELAEIMGISPANVSQYFAVMRQIEYSQQDERAIMFITNFPMLK